MLLSLGQISDRFLNGKVSSIQIKRWIKDYNIKHQTVGKNKMMLVDDKEFYNFMHLFPCAESYSSDITPNTKWMTSNEVTESIMGNRVSNSTVRRLVHENNIMYFQVGHNGTMFINKSDAKRLKLLS